jgi:hypothetical protein
MKPFSILIAFVLFCSTVMGQDNISFGPRAGISIMPVSNSEITGRTFKLGVNAGGYFNYNFNSWFSLRAELNYSLRKSIEERNDTASLIDAFGPLLGIDSLPFQLPDGVNLNVYSNTKSASTMHYVEIPVMGVLNLQNVKISAGPYVGIAVGAKTKTELSQDIPVLSIIDIDALGDLLGEQGQFLPFLINQAFPGFQSPETDEIKGTGSFNKIDVGIVSDITYQLDNNLSFGVRYQHGFLDYRADAVGDKKLYNSLQFHIGYRFGKGKNEGPIIRVRKNTGEN